MIPEPLHIGFDAKRVLFNQTGLGNYSRTLIGNMAEFLPKHRYFLYSPPLNFEPETFNRVGIPFQQSANMVWRTPKGFFSRMFGGSLWRSMFLGNAINKDKLHIYHGLSNELPLNAGKIKARKVVTIHDLIFMRYPQWYPAFDRWMYAQKWKHSCSKADLVIAISQQTKQDLMEFLNVPETKIEVVYQSCNPAFYNDYNDRLFLNHGLFMPQQYKLPPQVPLEYVLYVGAITERKNLLTLVKAMHLLQPKLSVPLVVVGKGKDYQYKVWQYIQQNRLEKQVIFIPDLPVSDLKAVYRCARLLVYPSLFEGFGLPVLEGLFSRTPVITSTGSCFAEAGGNGTLYVNPLNAEEMAAAIETVLTDGAQQMNMIIQGWEHAQQFKAETTTARLMQVYKQLL
ncbi:MAG TPA: glycosyltransferase family 1 protein [Chitinophagales bacterium]|nr:glycosyltransferase family 1 protein [Chitinophagales bacterium]HRK27769.1 glycosyltransferase family 1 protein [Chitinophagales bacterium]